MDLTIRGLQEAQRGNLKLIAAMKPGGALDEAIRIGTIAAHRYAVIETHVDTGTLKASHRMKYERGFASTKGTVFLDPTARNPRSRQLAAQYGFYEHERGGEHAFYQIVEKQHGPKIANQSIAGFMSRIS